MLQKLNDVWDGSVPEAATAVVKKIEGFSPTPYEDNPGNPNNTWTIGYGSIHTPDGSRVTRHTPAISEAEATVWLMDEMVETAHEVRRVVTVRLLVREAAALTSWTYNLGAHNLETSTMLRRLNNNDKAGAADEMRRWINQGGKPLLGLLRRRWAEAAIFVGVAPDRAVALAWANVNKLQDWPPFPIADASVH